MGLLVCLRCKQVASSRLVERNCGLGPATADTLVLNCTIELAHCDRVVFTASEFRSPSPAGTAGSERSHTVMPAGLQRWNSSSALDRAAERLLVCCLF